MPCLIIYNRHYTLEIKKQRYSDYNAYFVVETESSKKKTKKNHKPPTVKEIYAVFKNRLEESRQDVMQTLSSDVS